MTDGPQSTADLKRLYFIRAQAENELQANPQSVTANDRLWLCEQVERLLIQVERLETMVLEKNAKLASIRKALSDG